MNRGEEVGALELVAQTRYVAAPLQGPPVLQVRGTDEREGTKRGSGGRTEKQVSRFSGNVFLSKSRFKRQLHAHLAETLLL